MPVLFIIDDDVNILKTLEIALGTYFEVLTFPTGNHCLDALMSHPPDIVLTDYEMPGLNGLNLMEKIKKVFPNTPVILYSGKMCSELEKTAIQLGAKECLP